MIEVLKNPKVQEFILRHSNADLHKLALSTHKQKDFPISLAIDQIRSRNKAKKKLPEWYDNEHIIFPHGVSMEQCSSQSTAKYKAELISGSSLVDLTGGSGVDTYYLSRNFETTQFVEKNQDLCDLAAHNFNALASGNIEICNDLAEHFLSNSTSPPDWYFLDPARRGAYNKKVFILNECEPDLQKILPFLNKAKKGVLIKLAPLLDIKQLIHSVPGIAEIHIVAVNNECKELLIKLQNTQSPIAITTINITPSHSQKYSFSFQDELTCTSEFSTPRKYLYEPNAAIMKSGAFKKIGQSFEIFKLHPNSHLYTSDELKKNFPGRIFEIQLTTGLKKKKIEGFEEHSANVTVRNFPMTVAQIRKRTGLKEGGDKYLFATTILENSPKILVGKKLSFQVV